ncbi:hypothetical protein HGRIS_008737 [Hohenbuehelia grisea]|uniref:Uncharacterized protein n=1 Tax=Hohenbuehelia grisea TaxID=104357 RepID=A0ABR3J9Z3_9AGAR
MRLFQTCSSLRALVFVQPATYYTGDLSRTSGLRLFRDPRVVVLQQLPLGERDIRNEWEAQWYGELNMWQMVDMIAEEQAAKHAECAAQ